MVSVAKNQDYKLRGHLFITEVGSIAYDFGLLTHSLELL